MNEENKYEITIELTPDGGLYDFNVIKTKLPEDVYEKVTQYLDWDMPDAATDVLRKYVAEHEDEFKAMADYADSKEPKQ